MAERLEIAGRRERLIARCAVQRETIAGAIRDLERPIAVVDRMVAVGRFLRAHPVVVAAGVAAIVAFKRRTLLGVAARGIAAWRTWSAIGEWARRLSVALPRSRRPEKSGNVAS